MSLFSGRVSVFCLLKNTLGLRCRREYKSRRKPVLKWMVQNVAMLQDPAGNIKPDKEKSVEKIDGIVAAIMALDRSIRNKGETSVYDGRGILFI